MNVSWELILIFVYNAGCLLSKGHGGEVTISLLDGKTLHYNQLDAISSSSFPNVADLFDVKFEDVIFLRIQNTQIEEITSAQLKVLPYLETLEIVDNKRLTKIHEETFKWNPKLSYIDLSGNSLDYIAFDAFHGLFKKEALNSELILCSNRLHQIPRFNEEVPALKLLQLDGNPIKSLHYDAFTNMTKLTHLYLRHTQITHIPARIFENSPDVEILDLRETKDLVSIHEEAFVGSRLLKLILNGTSINHLPSKGLNFLKELHLANTPKLWEIPDGIVSIPSLRIVRVSSNQRFLCCAFQMKRSYVGIQMKEQNVKDREKLIKLCAITTPTTRSTRVYRDISTEEIDNTKTTDDPFGGGFVGESVDKSKTLENFHTTTEDPFEGFGDNFGRLKKRRSLFGDGFLPRNKSNTVDSTPTKKHDFIDNNFVTKIINHKNNSVICNTLVTGAIHYNDLLPVQCTPEPDALRPCDDIMGNVFLTALSWLVSIIAIVGNSIVFSVLLLSRRSVTVTKFLLMNLSLADLLLAVYLFILVSASGHTQGKYYNYVRSWQYGGGCSLSGFLAILSSQLSMLVLVVVTVERYFAIVYAMHFHRRVTMKHAKIAIGLCWSVASFLAFLPLVGINSYEEVALCLPFKVSSSSDLGYVGLLLIVNIVFFVLVLAAYVRMYWVVRSPHLDSGPRRNDSEVAKRMALLIFTDFFCWGPIAFVGLISAFGSNEFLNMDVKKSKYLLVIFFPINSLFNPFLYAVSTNTFKRDFFDLLIRCGLCHDTITKANEGLYTNSMSQKHSTRQNDTVVFSSQLSRNYSIASQNNQPLIKKLLMKKHQGSCSTPLMRSPPGTPDTPLSQITNDDVFYTDKKVTANGNGHVVSPVISIDDAEMETGFMNNNNQPKDEIRSMSRTRSEYDNVQDCLEDKDFSDEECNDNDKYRLLDHNTNNLRDDSNRTNVETFEEYDLSKEAIRKSPETLM